MLKSPLAQLGPVSYSRLDVFNKCPRRFYRRYVEKQEEPAGEAAEFGKMVHSIINLAVLSNCRSDIEAMEDLIVDIMSRENKLSQEDAIELADLWERLAHRRDEAILLTQRALDIQEQMPGTPETEKYFRVPIPDTDCELQGFVDLIQGSTIIDWKTGGNLKGAISSQQLALYAWALGTERGINPERFKREYIMLRFDQPQYTDRKSIQDALEWAQISVWEINSAFESASAYGTEIGFPATPNSFCKYCGFVDNCPMMSGEVSLPQTIQNEDEAVEAALKILNLETQLEQAKKLLADYCEQTGKTIEAGGNYFGFYPGSIRRTWDKTKILEEISHLEGWEKAVNIDVRGINALAKANPHLEEVIASAVTEKANKPSFKYAKSPPKIA